MTNSLKDMQQLVTRLSAAARAYYSTQREIMTDREYDLLYAKLEKLERDTGVVLAASPTRKVGFDVISKLEKATHDTPMLSLDKTKSVDALAHFLGDKTGLLSWKLDGLTIVLKYDGGKLQQAITRGNGEIGEDVTHNARTFTNLPLSIPYPGSLTLRGEAIITIADFNEINAAEGGKYKNPRNLTSGAVRQLDSTVAAARRMRFYAFGINRYTTEFTHKHAQLAWLSAQGFEIAEYETVTAQNITAAVDIFKEKLPASPVLTDGLVLTFDDIAYSASLGTTSKFPRDSIAFKWQDDAAHSTLLGIEWNTSRTGLINPVAVFAPVEIEGTSVSRASVHNVSILRELDLRIGDTVSVYKANMIIPQIAENISANDTPRGIALPENCPSCGSTATIHGSPEMLLCTNPSCPAQLLRALSHFVSRDAMNIVGLSEQTLEKLINNGFVHNYTDLFSLQQYRDEIIQLDGFGAGSFDKLTAACEAAKSAPVPNFLHALGIRHLGLAGAKLLSAHFNHNLQAIAAATHEQLLTIHGFGEAIAISLHQFFSNPKNLTLYHQATAQLHLTTPPPPTEGALSGLTFVITGDTHHFQNRKDATRHIEAHGGRVTSAISASTSYLVNNNPASTSSKNKKATALSIPIITEKEMLALSANP